MMPKKFHFTIFATEICAKHKRNTCEFYLYGWDHVCKVNEWCLVDCFHCKLRVSTQIMVSDYCIAKQKKVFYLWLAFNGPSGHFFFFWQFKIFRLLQTLV